MAQEKRIPFDVSLRSKIESGELLVVTRNGRPARIVCWDKKSQFPIIALISQS
jgi:hypothetical protein